LARSTIVQKNKCCKTYNSIAIILNNFSLSELLSKAVLLP